MSRLRTRILAAYDEAVRHVSGESTESHETRRTERPRRRTAGRGCAPRPLLCRTVRSFQPRSRAVLVPRPTNIVVGAAAPQDVPLTRRCAVLTRGSSPTGSAPVGRSPVLRSRRPAHAASAPHASSTRKPGGNRCRATGDVRPCTVTICVRTLVPDQYGLPQLSPSSLLAAGRSRQQKSVLALALPRDMRLTAPSRPSGLALTPGEATTGAAARGPHNGRRES